MSAIHYLIYSTLTIKHFPKKIILLVRLDLGIKIEPLLLYRPTAPPAVPPAAAPVPLC